VHWEILGMKNVGLFHGHFEYFGQQKAYLNRYFGPKREANKKDQCHCRKGLFVSDIPGFQW
jgi:hypothetical protein